MGCVKPYWLMPPQSDADILYRTSTTVATGKTHKGRRLFRLCLELSMRCERAIKRSRPLSFDETSAPAVEFARSQELKVGSVLPLDVTQS